MSPNVLGEYPNESWGKSLTEISLHDTSLKSKEKSRSEKTKKKTIATFRKSTQKTA